MKEFERAMEAVFGERACEFSSEAKQLLRLLYSEGLKEGRQIERDTIACSSTTIGIKPEIQPWPEITLEGITAAANLLKETRRPEFSLADADLLKKVLGMGLIKERPRQNHRLPLDLFIADSCSGMGPRLPPKPPPSFEIMGDWHLDDTAKKPDRKP